MGADIKQLNSLSLLVHPEAPTELVLDMGRWSVFFAEDSEEFFQACMFKFAEWHGR